jgi:beta-glucosidase
VHDPQGALRRVDDDAIAGADLPRAVSAERNGALLSRRTVLGASGAVGLGVAAAANAATAGVPSKHAVAQSRPGAGRGAPKGFLWGVAISGHQSEGNNVNSDSWLNETVKPTVFREPSGDACDSYHRYEDDIALAGRLGFNCYRLGIEWARIEPEPGVFSIAELDHYVRVLETCHAHGLAPIVTYNHFTVPRWFAIHGGFEVADGADLFARFAERATARLGSLIAAATPFNEANIARLVQLLPDAVKARPIAEAMIAASAKASGSERFSSILFADPNKTEPVMLDAHAKAYQAIKAGPGDFPVGVSLSIQAIEAAQGGEAVAQMVDKMLYGAWLDAASRSDFVGVQTYTRARVGPHGALPPPAGAELTAAGYEFYPQALGETIRYVAKAVQKPIYVTESGIATDDDSRRIAFIDQALAQVRACLDEGVDVRSYIYWSLLDNFEWTAGYSQHFGLVSVDRATFARSAKPSASHLGRRARANQL